MKHFNIPLINKGKSFKLTREEFALINTTPSLPCFNSLKEIGAYIDDEGSTYSDAWCIEYRELCLKNYDLNMEYFSKLEYSDFNKALNSLLAQYPHFREVTDLNNFAGIEGFYIMVLDEYKQIYIGKTENIKQRIMQHWSRTKPFDRTLFPMYAWNKSCFSIDFFRALDTTRIYVWRKKISSGIEENLIKSIPAQFCTNRIGGDITEVVQAINTINKRNL